MPQLRKNPITREWVIIATERSKRPSDFQKSESASGASRPAFSEKCPFCAGNEHMTPPEVLAFRSAPNSPDSQGWWVRVVGNRFPALSKEGELDRSGVGMYDFMNGVGAHEVIIETPEHNKCVSTVAPRQAEEIWWACRQRMLELEKDRRFKYILVFRNNGKVAGASLEHPHSQLIALPMVPKDIKSEIKSSQLYHEYHDRCIFCDMIRQELHFGKRIIVQNEHFVAFQPFAPKYPYETWVMPKEHSASFPADGERLIPAFSRIVQDVLRRIGKCLNYPPYNYTLHTAPCDHDNTPDFHWHLEIMPRLTIAAGFEMGTGVYINCTAPEDSAADLRAAGEEVVEEAVAIEDVPDADAVTVAKKMA